MMKGILKNPYRFQAPSSFEDWSSYPLVEDQHSLLVTSANTRKNSSNSPKSSSTKGVKHCREVKTVRFSDDKVQTSKPSSTMANNLEVVPTKTALFNLISCVPEHTKPGPFDPEDRKSCNADSSPDVGQIEQSSIETGLTRPPFSRPRRNSILGEQDEVSPRDATDVKNTPNSFHAVLNALGDWKEALASNDIFQSITASWLNKQQGCQDRP